MISAFGLSAGFMLTHVQLTKCLVTFYSSVANYEGLGGYTCSDPLGQYSVRIHCSGGSMHAPTNLTMWSFCKSLI